MTIPVTVVETTEPAAQGRSERLLQMIRLLADSPGGMTASELARGLGVSKGTVLYDVDLLTYIVEIYEETAPGDGRGTILYCLEYRRLPECLRRLLWPEPEIA